MKRQFRWVLLFAMVMAVGLALLFFFSGQPNTAKAGNQNIALRAPTFVEIALASNDPSVDEIASVLDSDAGITAYFQTTPLTLSAVEGLFHTVSNQTSNYILGTISVPDNYERYDVNVYIHESGWILLYYFRDDPAVMIFDWQKYTGTMNPTRFQVVSNQIMSTLSRSAPNLTYYDFRYPNATNLLLAVEDTQTKNGAGAFTILDTNFQYFERSWFLGGDLDDSNYGSDAELRIDDIQITTIHGGTTYTWGSLTPVQLQSDQPHDFYIRNYNFYTANSREVFLMGALTIVYGPQP